MPNLRFFKLFKQNVFISCQVVLVTCSFAPYQSTAAVLHAKKATKKPATFEQKYGAKLMHPLLFNHIVASGTECQGLFAGQGSSIQHQEKEHGKKNIVEK